jgi:hypothetical protein
MRPSIFLLEHALHDWGGADAVHCHLGYGGRPWKKNAVEKSLKSLREAIDKWKGENGVTGPVSEIAEKPKPIPYWRSEVSPSLFLPPDMVTDASYTLCWKGVVSPVVCTSGTKLCW